MSDKVEWDGTGLPPIGFMFTGGGEELDLEVVKCVGYAPPNMNWTIWGYAAEGNQMVQFSLDQVRTYQNEKLQAELVALDALDLEVTTFNNQDGKLRPRSLAKHLISLGYHK